MTDIDPERTFRGLPLTPEQDAEIRHYIKGRKQHGLPWDTPELAAMLRDMLEPPPDDDNLEEDLGPDFDETRTAAERAEFSIEDEMDPIESYEERHAAMESEAMKRLNR
ncbi:MAG TPA: hypothetical protein VGZ01_05960 [Trinickia sp.]|jgi:hypothetical protein|nr:hypothetical protein [Trinickia sp.]